MSDHLANLLAPHESVPTEARDDLLALIDRHLSGDEITFFGDPKSDEIDEVKDRQGVEVAPEPKAQKPAQPYDISEEQKEASTPRWKRLANDLDANSVAFPELLPDAARTKEYKIGDAFRVVNSGPYEEAGVPGEILTVKGGYPGPKGSTFYSLSSDRGHERRMWSDKIALYVKGGSWVPVSNTAARRGAKSGAKMVPRVYDNGGTSFDRYTITLNGTKGLGLSDNPDSPQGFSQWGAIVEGPHLGRPISFDQLPDRVKRHAEERLASDGSVTAARKIVQDEPTDDPASETPAAPPVAKPHITVEYPAASPELAQIFREWHQISAQFESLKKTYNALERQESNLRQQVGDAFKQAQLEVARVDDLLVEFKESVSQRPAYGKLWPKALSKVNAQTRQLLEKLVEEFSSESIRRYLKVSPAPSAATKTSRVVQAGVWTRIKNLFMSLTGRLRRSVDLLERALAETKGSPVSASRGFYLDADDEILFVDQGLIGRILQSAVTEEWSREPAWLIATEDGRSHVVPAARLNAMARAGDVVKTSNFEEWLEYLFNNG